ncbi:MAG: UMP kinase [Ruminococcaceae bacterium]|nr:UMP kinase [Oscillospiraceae bacterium]
MDTKYKRVLIKLSGEAVLGTDIAEYTTNEKGEKVVKSLPIIDRKKLDRISKEIKKVSDMGVEVGIVFGGGNIWRGGKLGEGFDRTRADHMGMLATVINSIALSETLEHMGVCTRVMSSVEMPQFAEPYITAKAVGYLNKKKVVIFAGGTGISHMTTDTTSVLRGVEIDADVVMLAKNIDAIYTADPRLDPTAKRIERIDYSEILARGLKVIDQTATAYAMENNMPLLLFGLDDPENITKAIVGGTTGTVVEKLN